MVVCVGNARLPLHQDTTDQIPEVLSTTGKTVDLSVGQLWGRQSGEEI